MPRAGEVLDNPVTGERIEFRDSDGDALAFDYFLRPGGFALGRLQHRHPRQSERVHVQSGQFDVRVDGDEWTATPGTQFEMPPGTPHTLRNDGPETAHAVVEIRPALDLASFFETTFGLAHDGRTTRVGLPGPLHLAVLADEYRDEFALATVPRPLQRAAATALAPLGRLAGYRAHYPRYSRRPAAAANRR